VHRALIARQRHHLAERAESGQKPVEIGDDAPHAVAAMGRDQFSFADPKPLGQIALAQLGIVDPRPADIGRRCFRVYIHGRADVHGPPLFVENEFALAGDLQPVERVAVLDDDLLRPAEQRVAGHDARMRFLPGRSRA
jgi:hypothetical protein